MCRGGSRGRDLPACWRLTARMQGDTLPYSVAVGRRNPAPHTHELDPDSLQGSQRALGRRSASDASIARPGSNGRGVLGTHHPLREQPACSLRAIDILYSAAGTGAGHRGGGVKARTKSAHSLRNTVAGRTHVPEGPTGTEAAVVR